MQLETVSHKVEEEEEGIQAHCGGYEDVKDANKEGKAGKKSLRRVASHRVA